MLAHELGRLVLHSTCIGTDVEDHANAFAADAGEVVRGAWPSCGHPALMRTRVRGATGVIAMKTVAHHARRLSAAARSLGLPYRIAMLRVVLPQAFRNVVPMLFNEFITLLKETSVAGYIGIDDLTRAGQNIQALTLEHSQPLVMVALIYLAMVLVLTELVRRLERWLHRSRRA